MNFHHIWLFQKYNLIFSPLSSNFEFRGEKKAAESLGTEVDDSSIAKTCKGGQY